MFVNREKETERLSLALARKENQLIVVYGRRRCGKSTLLRKVLPGDSVYYAADMRESPLQISSLSDQISNLIPGFGKVIYPDWESLLLSLNRSLDKRVTLCIDEFPYIVKNNPELPSVIQRLWDGESLGNLNLVLCGSSQQMMQGIALNSNSALYGRCSEIILINPLNVHHLSIFLKIPAVEAINEYSIWGGIPRYWEIRKTSASLVDAVKYHVLDRHGVLHEEPERLFADEMRTSVQAYSILSLIAGGCHRLSEIAGRLGKPATQLSRILGFLTGLRFIRREVPFGENVKSTKRSLYKIEDPFMDFYFTFILRNKSMLEYGLVDEVWAEIEKKFDQYVSLHWEVLCRRSVPFLEFGDARFIDASRWWGNCKDGRPVEIDIVAGSRDKRSLLVGEVKWSEPGKDRLIDIENQLDGKISGMPFSAGKKIIKALFVKQKPDDYSGNLFVFDASDIIKACKK